MDSYTGFASLYEEFMDNIPYDEWVGYIVSLLRKNGIDGGLVCELGCGTGEVTRRLSKAGYDMIGIDSSTDMLEVAMYEHAGEADGILYLNQDMREMELFGTVKAFVSVCDTMNYLLSEEELKETFRLCNNYLDRDGILIFDMKTRHFYRDVLGNRTITDLRNDACLVWENSFDPEKGTNKYDVSLFRLAEGEDLYERIDETHLQQAYDCGKIKELLEEAGLEFVCAYDAFTNDPPTAQSERIYFIAKEKTQEGKLYV